eukprot:7390941-Prymnesium_polylepis.1
MGGPPCWDGARPGMGCPPVLGWWPSWDGVVPCWDGGLNLVGRSALASGGAAVIPQRRSWRPRR